MIMEGALNFSTFFLHIPYIIYWGKNWSLRKPLMKSHARIFQNVQNDTYNVKCMSCWKMSLTTSLTDEANGTIILQSVMLLWIMCNFSPDHPLNFEQNLDSSLNTSEFHSIYNSSRSILIPNLCSQGWLKTRTLEKVSETSYSANNSHEMC